MTQSLQQRLRQAMDRQQAGDLAGARDEYAAILQAAPDNPDALHLSGLASLQLGDPETAVALIQKAVDQVPDHPILRNNLGLAMHRCGTLVAAAGQLQKALELQPDHAGAHMNLGAVFSDLGDREGALEHGLKAVELDPDRSEAWFNLGLFLLARVELPQAIEAFRRALKQQPRYPAAAASLLFTLHHAPQLEPEAIDAEHRAVCEALFDAPPPRPPLRRQDDDRIRIAYLSADFRRHAVNHFFEPLLENHDRKRFHVTCYSDTSQLDDVTGRLQGAADHWLDCRGMSDTALAERVRSDRIDLLIDLAGHTKGNRLGVFAQRPAPRQLGWLGYPGHPGLAALDGQLVSEYTLAPRAHDDAAADLLPLPGPFACFKPADKAPPVAPLPALERGHITYGSLHRVEKLNESVLDCWAELLLEQADARLLIVRDQLDAWQRRRILGHFAARGVDASRLELMPGRPQGGSFQEFWSEIDIYLDSFPWSGHTMACHALWSGVPVVTLAGRSHASRMVADAVHSLGRDDWIASDERAYREIAARLAQDLQALATIRRGLRKLMSESPLVSGAAFARNFESLIDQLL